MSDRIDQWKVTITKLRVDSFGVDGAHRPTRFGVYGGRYGEEEVRVALDSDLVNMEGKLGTKAAAQLARDLLVALDIEAPEVLTTIIEEGAVMASHVVEVGYYADDGNAEVYYPKAESGAQAAQEYVDTGDWGESEGTTRIRIHTWRMGSDADGERVKIDEETHLIAIDPEER